MITQTFGEMLFCPESDCLREFPAPEDMKYRVIISTKPPKEYLEAKTYEGNNSKVVNDSEDDVWGKEPSELTADQESDDKVVVLS